jgi:hypothetical protein
MGFRLAMTPERREHIRAKVGPMIRQALRDRAGIETEWQENDELYDGHVIPTDFPWPGSSSFAVPLAETYTNAVSGRLVDSAHAPDPTFHVRNLRPKWLETAQAASDWLEYRVRETIKLRNFSEKFMLTLSKHGSAVGFAPWLVQLSKRLKYNIEADDVNQEVGVDEVGPRLFRPKLQDFLFPKQTDVLREAPWRAHRVHLTEDDLQVRMFSNMYNEEATTKILNFAQMQPDEVTKRSHEMAGFATGSYDPFFPIWEWWGLLKLPGHKFATKLVIPYFLPSDEPLAILANFYPAQFDPFFMANFQPAETGLYGRGVCRMVRSGNIEVNKLHKHRVDNAMVANTRAFKVRNATFNTLGRKFRLWPGRLIPVGDMQDFEAIQLADVYQSTVNEELLTRRTLEQLVGLNDFALSSGGGHGLKRVGATAALTAVQESGRVLNFRLNHIRTVYAEMASWILEMDAHFQPIEEIQQVLGPKGAAALIAMFDAPAEAIRGHMVVELSASSATVNREIDRQSDILLMNIMGQYAERYFQIATAVTAGQMPPPLQRIGIEIGQMMNALIKDILRDFDKRNNLLVLSELQDVIKGGMAGAEDQPGLAGAAQDAGSTNRELAGAAARRQGLGGEVDNLGTLLRA